MDNSFYTSKSKFLVLLLIAATAVACDPRGGGQAGFYGSPIQYTALVDFSTLKSEVLTPYCISCHSGFSTESGIAAFVQAGNPSASALYTEAANGDMPPGGPALSQAAIGVISAYITQLAGSKVEVSPPEASGNPQGGALAQVSFAQLKKDILQPMCIECHSDFSTESGIQGMITPGDPDNSPLYTEVKTAAMPPSGPALTDKQLSEMSAYILGLKPGN